MDFYSRQAAARSETRWLVFAFVLCMLAVALALDLVLFAFLASSSKDQAFAGVLDYVFDDPYLPDEIKAVFGRLQIPMLKAALLDRRVLSDPQHPTRRFLDTLAQASVDLQPESTKGRALIELANGLALRIRDNFGDDLNIFETAKAELDAYLDVERADADRRLAEAVAQDERANARGEARGGKDSPAGTLCERAQRLHGRISTGLGLASVNQHAKRRGRPVFHFGRLT